MASPFGTAAARPTGFSFSTPQPGQPSTSAGMFGSMTPGPAFGAPAASAPAFGSPAPAGGFATSPAFGAPSTPTAFGATSPATGTAFGFASTPASASSASSLFTTTSTPLFGTTTPALGVGATATTPAPAFGAASSPSLFGSSFGAASSAAGFSFASPSAASSPFGAPAVGALAPSPFGGTASQMAPVAFSSSSFVPDAAIKEIGEVRSAYTPASSTYKFQHLFLNVVENPASRIKPASVDEMRWRQVVAQAGGPNNPDNLWPVQAVGFKDLLARAAAQQGAISENQERLRSLTELAHKMHRHHAGDLKTRTADVQKRHIELSARLLHVTRLLDALESRLASSLGYRGDVPKLKEHELARALGGVEAELAPSSSSGLQRRLEAVAAAARLRGGGDGAAVAAGSAGGQTKLDENSLQQLFAVLKEHADGVRHLQDVLKRDQLDIQIMSQLAGGASGAGADRMGA